MYSDELPTLEDTRPSYAREDADPLDFDGADIITTTLPVNAQTCYELFCDVDRIPDWVSAVRSVQSLAFDDEGRPVKAAFLASVGRGSTGYTLEYRYFDQHRLVTWSTPKGTTARVAGRALFLPLGERASMMHYQLEVDWPPALGLGRSLYDGHPASASLNDFRDYVTRTFMLC